MLLSDGSNQKKMNLSFVTEMTSDGLNHKETETGSACLNQKKMNLSWVAQITADGLNQKEMG